MRAGSFHSAARGRAGGVALVAVSAASFGLLPILARYAYAAGAQPLAVLCVRFGVAAVAMVALVRLGGRGWPRGATLAALVVVGGGLYVVQSLAFFTALTLTPAGLVSLLLYTFPAMVTVGSAVLLRQRVTGGQVLALTLASTGTALAIGPALAGSAAGIALGLASALAYAAYVLVSSRLLTRTPPLGAAAVVIGAAACAYAVAAVALRPVFPATAGGWAALAALGLVSTVVAITALFAGVARIGPADASTLSTLEPAVTVALAAAVLGERVGPVQLFGGALILTAVVLLSRPARGGSG